VTLTCMKNRLWGKGETKSRGRRQQDIEGGFVCNSKKTTEKEKSRVTSRSQLKSRLAGRTEKVVRRAKKGRATNRTGGGDRRGGDVDEIERGPPCVF